MPRERQDQGNSSIDLSAEHGQGEAKRLGRAHTTQGLDYPGKDLGLYANQKEKTLWNLKEIGKKQLGGLHDQINFLKRSFGLQCEEEIEEGWVDEAGLGPTGQVAVVLVQPTDYGDFNQNGNQTLTREVGANGWV